MGRRFEPFSENVDRPVIPTGKWQRVAGALIDLFGLFPMAASTPLNGAGAVAVLCFSVGSSLLFWGLMLKYFSALEEKLGLLIVELGFQSESDDLSRTEGKQRRETPNYDAEVQAAAPWGKPI